MSFEVQERISDLRQYEDLVAALRLAVEATENYDKLGRVVMAILERGPETPDYNTGGLELLLILQREGKLTFEMTGDD
jgi:hypothetical protein